ncbi:hypothetical protein AGMMS49942_23420 [Spirochaetia bacterium]|nr:hypothetical protein AGMMS49942_23420 [Spirochaetia bacterium]
MKFGNYTFYAHGVNNLGDNLQIIAIDEIYRQMGIPDTDIVYIDTNELVTYDGGGGDVVLPVTMPLVDYRSGGISGRFSSHIIPVFLGFTMVRDTLYPEEVDYLLAHEPIGCRDERTLNTVRKYKISAYLHGCITAALPQRETAGKVFDKAYLVDIPDGLEPYIPGNILTKAVYKTHLHSASDGKNPKELMLNYYQEYKDNAFIVITSLLHCSVPCMAAGIPVVLAKSAVSYRFGWLEKLLPIYEPDEYNKIDWAPKPVLYNNHKEAVLELTKNRLWDTYQRQRTHTQLDIKENNKLACDISDYYENRKKKKKYIVDAAKSLTDFIDENWNDNEAVYLYSVWGLTQIAEYIVSYISERYHNAKLAHVYDTFRKENFFGLCSEHPRNMKDNLDETVFVTTNGAVENARILFAELDKPQGTFAFMKVVR